jgi:hypothetical protein
MNPIAHLRDDELERLFQDWSTPVILCGIEQEIIAASGELSEDATNYSVCAVLMPCETNPTSRTAMQHAAIEQDFIVRAHEIPADLSLTACRILTADREWSVVQVTRSADGRVITLRGQAT